MRPCFLLHTDTPYRLYEESLSLDSPLLQCGIPNISPFCVVYAIWSNYRRTPAENFAQFFEIRARLLKNLEQASLPAFFSCMLSIEDASILENDLSRLTLFKDLGVRILTPLWQGDSELGGAWDTECGLSPFGKAVVSECFRLGILPDISHASTRSAYDILDLCQENGVPLFASHSNARAVCPHRRNLTDDLLSQIVKTQGLVGLCFAPPHLSADGNATLDDILRHAEYILSLGGEHSLAIGSDFDGIDSTPRGLYSIASLPRLAEAFSRIGYSDVLIHKIFFENADRFFKAVFQNRYHLFEK